MDQHPKKDKQRKMKSEPKEQESDEESTVSEDLYEAEYVYRLCRPGEDLCRGLEARKPLATKVKVTSHVHGKKDSPFISTCASKKCIEMYISLAIHKRRETGLVVKINLARLRRKYPEVDVFDLTDRHVLNREFKKKDYRGRNHATKYQEILIRGHIPVDCIDIVDEDDIEESTDFDINDYSSEDGDEDYYDTDDSCEEREPYYEDPDEQMKRRKLYYPDREDEESLKAKIEKKAGTPADMQRLVYTTKELRDGYTLGDYDIQNGSTVHLILRLKGGHNHI